MTVLISLHRWSKDGLSGLYSGHNNQRRPPYKVSDYRVCVALVVVVALFSTLKSDFNKVYIRYVDIRFGKSCDFRTETSTTSTTKV